MQDWGLGTGLRVSTGDTCITGWTITGPAKNLDFIGTYWQAAQGTYSVDLNGDDGANGIQQAFDVTAGRTYQVSFWMSGNFADNSSDPVKDLSASILSGVLNNYSFNTTGYNNTNMGWVQKTFTFVAGSNSATLKFMSAETANLDYGPVIDNVAVTDVTPSPEPGTMLLVSSALLGLGYLRRRK